MLLRFHLIELNSLIKLTDGSPEGMKEMIPWSRGYHRPSPLTILRRIVGLRLIKKLNRFWLVR